MSSSLTDRGGTKRPAEANSSPIVDRCARRRRIVKYRDALTGADADAAAPDDPDVGPGSANAAFSSFKLTVRPPDRVPNSPTLPVFSLYARAACAATGMLRLDRSMNESFASSSRAEAESDLAAPLGSSATGTPSDADRLRRDDGEN